MYTFLDFLEKKCTPWFHIITTHPPACVSFFKFCYFVSRKAFFKGIYALFLSVYQKEWLFSSFQCVLFFYYVAAINSLLGTLIQFSTFYSSRLPFRLVFNNLSKNLMTFSQHFDVPVISNRPFTAVPLVIEI